MKFSDFKQSFFNSRNDKKKLVNRIKVFCEDYNELSKFVERYRLNLRPAASLLNNAILGKNHLPKTYADLGVQDFHFFTNSLEQEMNWQVLAFLNSFEIINKFIQLRSKFEHNLISANYDQARVLLDKIESEICTSYWSIENRFIIDEYQFGSEKNWETRNKVLNERNNAFVQVFGSLASFKTEKDVSFFQFNEEFNRWQEREGLNNNADYIGIIEYFRFKGNFYSYSKFKHLPEILYRESDASIIDRYILFIRVSQYFISEQPKENNFLIFLLNKLHEKINDFSLKQMILATDKSYILNNEDINSEVIQILDEYTKGNYMVSKELSNSYIINISSSYMELLEVYSKSIVELNIKYEPITKNESFLNQITLHYYNILSKNSDTDNSLIELFKLSYTFNNSHIGLHLYSFISKQLGWDTEINYKFLESLNSKFTNPQLLFNLYQRESIATTYINNLRNNISNSITVNLHSQFYTNFTSQQINEHFDNVAESKKLIYKVRSLMLKEYTDECIEICKNILKSHRFSSIVNYEAVSSLFLCFLKKEDYRNAVILFVKTHLENQHLTKKMSVDNLNSIIIKSKFKKIGNKSTLIELPILLKISNVDKIKIKQTYELFLNGNNVNKPSELIENPNPFDLDKLIYFLKYVCIPEIMQLSKFFNSSYEVNEERIIITKYLAAIDIDDLDFYKNEIAELTQKNTISKVIGSIDERKIFVNEYKIRQTLKKSDKQSVLSTKQVSPLTNESFERYVKLLAYVKNNNEYKDISSIIQFGDNGEITYIEAEKNKIYKGKDVDVVLYLPAYRIFVSYFLYIRDLFIFSKEYGLEAYLSTRIRHGTLPNHLRSVFESYFLVTAQTDNIYADNQYWKDKLNIPEEQMVILQASLSRFSKEIDIFSKEIKDNYIQCNNEQNNEKSEALFKYSYNEQDLIFLFLEAFDETKNIDDFIEKSFIELWQRTEKNLEVVRYRFNIQFRDRYIELIDNLQSEINALIDKNSISELLNNLMTCRTEIQTKLSNISKWFRRSESSIEGEYEIQTLAETSIQIIKNLNPSFNFEIEKDICLNFNISGEYHQHIIDLINNCLFNIVKHSHLPCESVNAKLKIYEEENNLYLNFENCLSDASLHLPKLNAIKENWESSDANISSEGGTGFPKIKKILNSDLNRKHSDFDFCLVDNKLNIIISFETNGLKV